MKKYLFITLVFTVLWISLVAQTITMSNMGIKSLNDNPITPGSTVEVKFAFSPSGFIPPSTIVGPAASANDMNQGKVLILWSSSETGMDPGYSNYVGQTYVSAGNLDPQITNVENETEYECTSTFTLPPLTSIPSGAISFIVASAIYADRFGTYTYSNQLESGTGLAGYSAYLEINTNSAPTAESVAIENPEFAKVGQTLTGSYNYSDEDNDPQGTSTFRWLKSSTQLGTYSPIIGATSSNYTVQPSDADSYLKFEVTPVAASGTSPGIPVLSDASYKVTEAALADITPMAQTFYESSIADGTLGNVFIYAELTNAAFVTGTISGITMTGLPAGLSVGTITRTSSTKIKIEFSGASTVHEYNASVLDPNEVTVTIPSAMLVGVTNDLESANGFYIQFSNNAPTNLTTDDSDYNSVTISWDAPAGLNGSGTALQYYQVYRNDSYLEQVSHVPSKGAYTYTDTGLSTGVANTYKIQAIYDNDGSPLTNLISATPLGFTAFSIGEAEGIIDHETKSVTVTLDSGTNLTNLVASFTAPNTTVKIGETTQSSGVTANDFSSPITYTLSSTDGSSTTYTVSVQTVLSAPEVIQTGLNETSSSFTAKWGAVESSIAYMLDVATDSGFTTFVSGYQDLNVGSGTSRVVNGLAASTPYYFRVRAIADDPAMNSENSATATVNTSATGAGTGGTEIVNSETTTINVGSFDTGGFGTVTPSVTVTPSAFVSGANNSIAINMGHGTSPEGLIIALSFDNPSIGNATFTISYAGLSYDPTEVYFRIVGGDLVIPSASSIDAENDIISITISGLSKEAKAAYELQIVSNDATGQTLPIVLSSFTANVLVQGKVRLNWTTQSESGMMGFHILRNTTDVLADAIIVSPLIEATNTSNLATYSFTDHEIPGNGTYHFWLQSTDLDGQIEHYGPLTVLVEMGSGGSGEIPKVTALKSPYPNPFNPDLNIVYDLSETTNVQIHIYNSKGQLVKTLVDRQETAKSYRILWDGKDDSGRLVSSGAYFIKMSAGSYTKTTKAIMLK